MPIPIDTPDKVNYFAETDYRSKRVKFGIRNDDRAKHMYIIGKTGMGKSTMLENLAVQDIQNGEGICFIDPHGGTAETLLSYVPEERIKDVIYFAPFDQEFPVALNVMEDLGRDKRPLIASGLIGAFKKVWVDAWSARMEYLLSNALLALFETPGTTLLGVNRIFADKAYRNMIVANVTDPSVRSFWVDEYAKYSDKFATEATAAIQNKIGQFAANPLIRNMVGQPVSTFDIRKVMDERKILIVNLSKGRMGEGNANLVGSMLITKIYLAAMSRADVGADFVKGLPPFYLYVDEFQSFANESFADILSEARKYKLSLTIAHQYIEQMSEEVRAAVFGNVGSMISFRVGAYDAEVLEKEYAPAFLAEDMVNLGFAQIYLKLMIRGVGSAPFSATTLPPVKKPPLDNALLVIDSSRALYARPRAQVEEEIKKWHEPIAEAPRDPNAPPIPATRKYAPGARPQGKDDVARLPRSSSNTPSSYEERTPSRLKPSGDLRATLQSVLPQPLPPSTPTPVLQQVPAPQVLDTTPVVSTSTTPRRAPIVVPRAPYAPLAIHPSVPIAPTSLLLAPTPVLPTPPQTPSPFIPSPVHRPFAEQFAKLETEKKAPEVRVLPPNPFIEKKTTSTVSTNQESRPSPSFPHTPLSHAHNDRRHMEPDRRQKDNFQNVALHTHREFPFSPKGDTPLAPPPTLASLPQKQPVITAPLSTLKSSPKKDKGPSEQNLSSLRDALRAVTAKKEDAVSPEHKNTFTTEAPSVKQKESAPPSHPGFLPPIEDMPTESATADTSEHVSSRAEPAPSPASKSSIRAMEIPEDVLKQLLAD